jgi:soluble P-type ATPase
LLQQVDPHRAVAIGSGVSDIEMIQNSAFGIGVMSREGTLSEVIDKADLVFMTVVDALDFLLKPLRQRTVLGK